MAKGQRGIVFSEVADGKRSTGEKALHQRFAKNMELTLTATVRVWSERLIKMSRSRLNSFSRIRMDPNVEGFELNWIDLDRIGLLRVSVRVWETVFQ